MIKVSAQHIAHIHDSMKSQTSTRRVQYIHTTILQSVIWPWVVESRL